MAGIGFELKKIFNREGFLSNIKAYFLSALVIVGPTMICLATVTFLELFLTLAGIEQKQRELFMAIVTYSFVFSLILTNGFSMLVTRYVSDKIFSEEYNEILPSLYGVITVCLMIGGVIGAVFYYFSPLNFSLKFSAYILFMQLIIIWLLSAYISIFKDYMRIVKGFIMGLFVALICSLIFMKILSLESVLSCLLGLNTGMFIIILGFMLHMKVFLMTDGKNYFRFLSYFDKYPSLFFVGLFYAAGIYIHNFVFWTGDLRVVLQNTYTYCPYYDVPSFYAMLTIVTGMVIFVVTIETSFYEKYKKYYTAVCGTGKLEDINSFKNEIYRVLTQELSYAMVFQLVLSLLFMIMGMYLLPKIGFTAVLLDMFKILTLGSYGCIFMFIIMLLLLYFDDRKGALLISALFMFGNLLLTYITYKLGESFYGLGFFLATMLSLFVGFLRLIVFIKGINYYTFCAQPIYVTEKKRFFTKLAITLEGLLK